MTNEEAKKMLKARLECLKRDTSGTDIDCNYRNCDECNLCYEQGNMGEQKEALEIAIKALETASCIKEKCAYCPHCERCDVDDETLEIKALEQQPCEDCISREEAINAAIDAVDEWDGGCNTNRATMISHAIKDLPSVTPKPLTPQPCEDAISRQAVKEMLTEEWTKYMPMESDVNLSFVLEKISELPSVTPKTESEGE